MLATKKLNFFHFALDCTDSIHDISQISDNIDGFTSRLPCPRSPMKPRAMAYNGKKNRLVAAQLHRLLGHLHILHSDLIDRLVEQPLLLVGEIAGSLLFQDVQHIDVMLGD